MLIKTIVDVGVSGLAAVLWLLSGDRVGNRDQREAVMQAQYEPQPEDQVWDRYITVWAKAVDAQMHFNEMSMRSRRLGLTFVVAALGVAVVLLSRQEDFSLQLVDGRWTLQIHISVILIVAAIFALATVRELDLNVYHRMLRGAVAFGEDFEEVYLKQIFPLEKGMTQAISHFSRFDDARTEATATGVVYLGSDPRNAEEKIRRFYRRTLWFLAVSAVALFLLTNVSMWTAGTD